MKVDERKMEEIPEEDRPREKLLKHGPEALNDAELLAILLRTGVKGCNVYELARRFVAMLGAQKLMEMRSWTVDDFRGRLREDAGLRGIGDDKCATILAALEIGRRIFPKEGVPLKKPLLRPEEVAGLMFADTSRYMREGFWAIYLDRRRVPLRDPEMLTLGLSQQTLIDVRTLFHKAILFNAAGLYLIHNHPSGDVRPSSADLETTRALVRAGKILQIPVLDHVILGRPEVRPSFYSIRTERDCEF